MPSFVERLGRAIQKTGLLVKENKGVSFPLPPKPDIITKKEHPLRFYPGFSEYVEAWNTHSSGRTRLDLQAAIQSAELETGELEPQTQDLKSRVDECRKSQKNQRTIYETQSSVPKDIRKRTIRALRRNQEKTNREFQEKERARKAAQARLETATTALAQLDDQFAYELDEDGVRFYILERMRNSPDAVDGFVLRYFAEKGITREAVLEKALNSINFSCFHLARYYSGLPEKPVIDKVDWLVARQVTRRQLERRSLQT